MISILYRRKYVIMPTDKEIKDFWVRMDRQNAEFDALRALGKALVIHDTVAVVDDDYPAVRHVYEQRLRSAVSALRTNGRFARPFKVITLCGSARFEAAFKRWNETLTLEGHAVFSLSVYPSDKAGKDWYTAEEKVMLDRAHKMKIDASDEVFVVDVDYAIAHAKVQHPPYIGDSTRSEIAHAEARGITIRYASRPETWK